VSCGGYNLFVLIFLKGKNFLGGGMSYMPYELDFIGVDVETTDADAICFRWKNDIGGYTIGVYDGGTSVYGEELRDHLLKYYFEEGAGKTIDFVICSHSDQDHSAGLKVILNSFKVNHLIMNRPWAHTRELFLKVDDGRITEESLERRLRETYPYIAELEQLALDKGVQVHDAFQGLKIYDKLKILSPTKQFYIDLLVESTKTPLIESSIASRLYSKLTKTIKNLIESWNTEYLKEDVETSAENEMSLIVLGEMDEEKQ
jgi:hypothetical protein